MKKKIIIILSILVTIFTLTGISIYAAFTFKTQYDTDITYYTVDSNNPITLTSAGEAEFQKAGDINSFTVEVENKNSTMIGINFSIAMGNESTTGVMSSVLVYLDSEFKGTLSNVISSETDLLDEDIIIAPGTTRSVELMYELHNATDTSVYEDTDIAFTTNIECNVKTVDTKKYSMVTTEEELTQAIAAINANSSLNKEIILANKITLTSDITVSNDCTINLNGFNIEGKALIVDNGLVCAKSYTSASISNVTVNGENALFWKTDDNVSATVTASVKQNDGTYVDSYSKSLAATQAASILGSATVTSGSDFSIFGENTVYSSAAALPEGNTDYTYANGVITPTTTSGDVMTSIELNGTTYDFKINGSSTLNAILKELKHITYYAANDDGEFLADLTADIFLPTNLKDLGATISWESTNESILSSTGKTSSAGTGIVTLIATIEYNGSKTVKTFQISVLKQNNKMKFQYLLSKIGVLYFTNKYPESGGFNELVTASNYQEKLGIGDLGITNIEYDLDSTYYYLLLTNGGLALNEITFQKLALLGITVTFEDGSDDITDDNAKIQTGDINVQIDLSNNPELIKNVFEYITNYISSQSVLQNMLSTRSTYGNANENGDFSLPNSYMGFVLKYAMGDSSSAVYSFVDGVVINDKIYYVTNDKVTYNGQSYAVTDKTITVSYTYSVNNGKVTVGEESYDIHSYIKIDTSYYLIEDNKITYQDEEYTVTDGAVTIDETDYFSVTGIIYEGSFKDSSTGKVTIDESYDVCKIVHVNPVNFTSSETKEDIQVSMYLADGTSFVESTNDISADAKVQGYSNPTFTIPAAIHVSSLGNGEVFYSVKYQVLQQTDYKPSDLSSIDTISEIDSLGNYILLHDIDNCQSLIINMTSERVILDAQDVQELFDAVAWATSTDTSNITSFGHAVGVLAADFIKNDGKNTVSDQEEYAIVNYFKEKYAYFEELYNLYVYGSAKSTRKNTLTEEDIADIINIIGDDGWSAIVSWATSTTTSNVTLASALTDIDYGTYSPDYIADIESDIKNDGNESISHEEEMAFLRYAWTKLSASDAVAFYNIWLKWFTYDDNIITTTINSAEKNPEYLLYDGLIVDVVNSLISWANWSPANGSSTSASYNTGATTIGAWLQSAFPSDYLMIKKLLNISDTIWSTSNSWLNYTTTDWLGSVNGYYAYNSFVESEYSAICSILTADSISSYSVTYNNSTYNAFSTDYYNAVRTSSSHGSGYRGWVTSYNYSVSTTELINGIKYYTQNSASSSLKTLYTNLINWTKGTSITLNTYTSNYSKYLSDGKETISYEENVVIRDFLSNNYSTVLYDSGSTTYYTNVMNGFDYTDANGETVHFNGIINLDFATNSFASAKSGLVAYFAEGTDDFKTAVANAQTEGYTDNGFDGLTTISKAEYNYIYSIAVKATKQDAYQNKLSSLLNVATFTDKTFGKYSGNTLIADVTGATFVDLIKNESPLLKYATVTSQISAEMTGISLFNGLVYFEASSDASSALFDSSANANKLLESVSDYCQSITHLDMHNSGINTISYISNISKLEYLDVSHTSVSDIKPLLDIKQGQLSYLDISYTSVDLTYAISILNSIYSTLTSRNMVSGYKSDISHADIRYSITINSVTKKYYLSANSRNIYAMICASLLKEIGTITSSKMQAPSYIRYNGTSYAIAWNTVEETYQSIIHSNDADGYYFDVSGLSNGTSFVISATVVIDGSSYTRYFEVTVNK